PDAARPRQLRAPARAARGARRASARRRTGAARAGDESGAAARAGRATGPPRAARGAARRVGAGGAQLRRAPPLRVARTRDVAAVRARGRRPAARDRHLPAARRPAARDRARGGARTVARPAHGARPLARALPAADGRDAHRAAPPPDVARRDGMEPWPPRGAAARRLPPP